MYFSILKIFINTSYHLKIKCCLIYNNVNIMKATKVFQELSDIKNVQIVDNFLNNECCMLKDSLCIY